jgi:hypothetical protein
MIRDYNSFAVIFNRCYRIIGASSEFCDPLHDVWMRLEPLSVNPVSGELNMECSLVFSDGQKGESLRRLTHQLG